MPVATQEGHIRPTDVSVGERVVGLNVHRLGRGTHHSGEKIVSPDRPGWGTVVNETTVYEALGGGEFRIIDVQDGGQLDGASRVGTTVTLPDRFKGLVGPAKRRELAQAGLALQTNRDGSGKIVSAKVVRPVAVR